MLLLINLFILLLFIFVSVYAIYCFLIAFVSKNRCNYVRKGKYPVANYYNNIVVIIYTHNNEKEIAPLLEALNKQDYPTENFKTYIILDNCTDNSSNILEMIGGANFFRIGDSFTAGKDEAITQLLERLLTVKNINAFAFLGTNRSIDSDFLKTINMGLFTHDVLVASTTLKGEPQTLKEKIIGAYNTYENNIINTSRSMLDLSTLINSDCCVIKQNVIEKVQCIDFKNINTEFKYSLMLSKLNYKVSFDPNIHTYLDYKNYQIRKPSFSYRISLLKNSIPMFWKSSFKFIEFCLSAIQPSMATLVFLLGFFAWIIYTFNFSGIFAGIFSSKVLMALIVIFVVSGLFSINNSKIPIKQLGYLFLYPIYSFLMLLRNLPIVKQICDLLDKFHKKDKNERYTVPVVVLVGNQKKNCNIELIKEDGMIRGIFSYKNKKQSTDLYLRIYDVIKSISDLLTEHDFDLQICQNCKYFTTKSDGTINVVKGCCSFNSSETQQEETVMLWQNCPNYVPNKEKIVDLNQYRKND